MIKFHAFRYFLVPFGEQITINHIMHDKKQLMYDIFRHLQSHNKIDTIYWNKRYVLYITKTLAEGFYVCKFAREVNITIDKEGSTDIESIPESSLPYIYIIVDLHRQIILIQNKHSVFNRIETPKNAFTSMFNTLLERFDYEFSLDAITSQNDFWRYYENNVGIFELELRMKSPNLFGGIVEAESLLKQINADFNNTETTLKVKNSQGKLKIAREKIQSFIKYVSGGGGEWVLKILTPKREVRRISSRKLIRIVEFKSVDQITNRETVITKIANIDEVIEDIYYPNDDNGDNRKS